MDLEALKAEFAARGGKVTRVSEGARAIANDRDIYRAMREGTLAQADSVKEAQASESRYHAQRDAFDAAKYDGWSNANALDYASEAV